MTLTNGTRSLTTGKTPLLFTPLKIGRVQLKNRIAIAPMCQYSAKDGLVNDWHLVHLGARAIGGAGIVMVEATGVEARGRISPGCTGLWNDKQIAPLKRIADFIKEQDSVPAIQLAHAGRKASTYPLWVNNSNTALPPGEGWQPIGPSPIAFGGGNDQVPLEATLADIAGFVQSFVSATKRALAAGFEIIELHFAHGYLVQTFLSQFSNKRTDQYGGSFENRIRLALEIVTAVKAVLPEDFPLFVRISCDDNLPKGEGWELEDSIELAKRFKQLGVHLVDCSSGLNSYYAKSWFHNPRHVNQVEMAGVIQKEVNIPTGAVGGIVNAHWAEKILQQNKATLIFIARGSLDDPNWPIHAAFELGATNNQLPKQYISIGENWRTKFRESGNQKEIEENGN